MRSTKIIKICSSSLCTCLHHMVILRTRNKITDFFMILAWASPFKGLNLYGPTVVGSNFTKLNNILYKIVGLLLYYILVILCINNIILDFIE